MADIYLYNTLSRTKELFTPIHDNQVRIYQCGPTVYWTQHLGNMRASVISDLLVRFLQYQGYDVNFVRNYTDVGHLSGDNEGDADSGVDRMAKGAKREGISPEAIADKYTKIFDHDVHLLHVQTPNHCPAATSHIDEMITMVQTLLNKGFAYTTDLAIYFDVSKAKDYTRLSGQKLDKNRASAGHGSAIDPDKRSPHDFALWFFKAGQHTQALQTWQSPFSSPLVDNGEGFPGWHIECSAMSQKYLGDTIDIHLGGIEHIPVHHTNEIAQSESATGHEFVKYWMHWEHLLVDNAKMSKSEGTAYSLQEVIDKGFDPLAVRYFFLQAHYRSKQNFTWEALTAAQNGLDNLRRDVIRIQSNGGTVDPEFTKTFTDALADDLNVPAALAVVYSVLKSEISDADKYATIIDFDQVLGLGLDTISASITTELPAAIRTLIGERNAARTAKDWAKSDRLREQIEAAGYTVEDTPNGTQVSLSN
jgi:cysteinyl-tRNA synthetase